MGYEPTTPGLPVFGISFTGRSFWYTVIAQPQKEHWLTKAFLHQARQCPPRVKLKPLRNR